MAWKIKMFSHWCLTVAVFNVGFVSFFIVQGLTCLSSVEGGRALLTFEGSYDMGR